MALVINSQSPFGTRESPPFYATLPVFYLLCVPVRMVDTTVGIADFQGKD